MSQSAEVAPSDRPSAAILVDDTRIAILLALSSCHLLNDVMQSLVPSIYPLLKASYGLDYGQIGVITMAFQLTASLLQPLVGMYTDRHPTPYSLATGMGCTLIGLLCLAMAPSFLAIVGAAALVGVGSSIFHPEASRVARLASGGRHGFAQSLFQMGGNAGSALGPLCAAFIVVPRGQGSIAYFSVLALVAMVVLTVVAQWYARKIRSAPRRHAVAAAKPHTLGRGRVAAAVTILLVLMFSKYIYMTSLQNFYTFYLIHNFGVGLRDAQIFLFLFLGATAVGTFLGGPIGDRIGRRYVIWCSILGVLPLTLALPYAGLVATAILTVLIGLILSSAFAAILVFATELMPGRVGLVAGLFYGLAFGISGLGAALLGVLADHTSIDFVYKCCSFLPAVGLLAYFLPRLDSERRT
jgi:FSR family fosmidomycin resistance protein-like MFS transporter